MDKNVKAGIILVVGILIIGLYFLFSNADKFGAGGNPISTSPKLGVNRTYTLSGVNVSIASSSATQLLIISNTGPGDAWLSPTTTNLTVDRGFLLKGSSTQVFAGDNLYPDWWAFGTTTLSVVEL